MTRDSERVWEGERYIVVHHKNPFQTQPYFKVWDRQREITERRFWYMDVEEATPESQKENAIEHAKELDAKKA